MTKPALSRTQIIEQADSRVARDLAREAVDLCQLALQCAQRTGPQTVRQELKQIAELGSWAGLMLERGQ